MGGIKACFKACGLDETVVELVVCFPDVAETITRNPLVKHITCELDFTFSSLYRAHVRSHRQRACWTQSAYIRRL